MNTIFLGMVGPWQWIIIIMFLLVFPALGALLAKSRNRTPWKGALVSVIPLGFVLLLIFLKTKGKRTKRNRRIDQIIIICIIALAIGGIIAKNISNKKFDKTMAKYSYNTKLNEMGDTYHYSMYHNTLIRTVSVEEFAKENDVKYKAAVTYFEWMDLSSMSQKVVDSYKEKEGVIEKIRSVGYTSFQVKRLYKDGTIKESQIIKLD